jgi:hypothetical protein
MTRYIFVPFAAINTKASQRPPGYLDVLMRRAHAVDAEGLHFTEQVYRELIAEFNGRTATLTSFLRADRVLPPLRRVPHSPVPRDKWPRAVRLLARFAKEPDHGIGDTIARLTGSAGGELFKKWYKKIMNSDCGCSDRQKRLNSLYSYVEKGSD